MTEPALPCLAPEEEGEEEDQWEDVSEGEEEEGADAAEGSGSQDSLVEEETRPSSASQDEEPQQPGRDGQLSLAMPAPQAETPSTEGKPLTPFSPAEGYHPVSDWGEEMELSSPWADATKREAPPANAGKGERGGVLGTLGLSGVLQWGLGSFSLGQLGACLCFSCCRAVFPVPSD